MEEVTKTVDGKQRPSSDFLVVGDPAQVNTWHLPVKVNGVVDRRLMGAAWAALHSGYRGNVYEGPGKAEAIRKLTALYKAENMEAPVSKVSEMKEIAGSINDLITMIREAFYKTFDPPLPGNETNSRGYRFWCKDTFLEHPVLGSALIIEDEKAGVLYHVPIELNGASVSFAGREEWRPVRLMYEFIDEGPVEVTEFDFAESGIGYAIGFSEADLPADTNRAPVELDLKIITPGPGNKRDNYYYPRAILERDGGVFEGVDVYITDHHENERSERTKVGKIKAITGYTEDGGPIGRLLIYDPDTAEKARNRAAAGELETLHCSILASGKARKGQMDGKDYKIVESIDHAEAVDLVSRAGAGGKALALAESEAGMPNPKQEGMSMDEERTNEEMQESNEEEQATFTEQEQEPEPVPVLERERVREALVATNLPPASVFKLAEAEYENEAGLAQAIKAEVAEVKRVTNSGKPFGQGEGTAPQEPVPLTEAQAWERFNNIMRQAGARTVEVKP